MSSEFKTSRFQSFDGCKLFYRFIEGHLARGTMVILHGLGEHSGRYEKFVNYMKPLRTSWAVFDLRGHGQSEGVEMDVERFDDYLRDTTSFIHHLKKTYQIPKPIVLFGHSFGGLIAIHWAIQNSKDLSSLILSSPCFGLPFSRFVTGFSRFMSWIRPTFCISNPVYPVHLSHHLKEVENYKQDALIKRKITVRLLQEMLSYMKYLESFEKIKIPVPVYGLIAGDERIVDGRKTKQIFQKIDAPDKDLSCFESYYHEIFNELGQEEAFKKLCFYIERSWKLQGLV